MRPVQLVDLIDAVERAGGGLSDDEPAMAWQIRVRDGKGHDFRVTEVVVEHHRIDIWINKEEGTNA